jgi:hypothetical protein
MVHQAIAIGICNRTGTQVVPTITKGYSAYCSELDEDLYDFEWTKFEEIYYFEDWIMYMQSMSDYSLYELECFEEHYQNLLPFEENLDNFIKQLND